MLADFGGDSDDVFGGLVQQPDGKLVAAGGSDSPRDFVLLRYNPDGSLDASFGVGGRVLTDFGGGAARALVRQPDGKLVAARNSTATGRSDFALARYNSDETLDVSFGVGGHVVTDFGAPRRPGPEHRDKMRRSQRPAAPAAPGFLHHHLRIRVHQS